jgi:hypothetical protein
MAIRDNLLTFPITVWETAETKEDLEDWILSRRKDFISEMRRLRREDLAGEFKPFKTKNKK